MKITKKTINNHIVTLNVSVDAQVMADLLEKSRLNLAKHVTIAGFRKGKAPLDKALSAVNEQKVWAGALKKAELQARNFVDQDESELTEEVLGEVIKSDLGTCDFEKREIEFQFQYETVPTVALADYQTIVAHEAFVSEVSEQALEKALADKLAEHALLVTSDNPATLSDVVVFDFTGYFQGKLLENGAAKNYQLDLSNSNFVPGYAENLVGLKAGESKRFSVKFPANYAKKELADQDVEFEVLIHAVKTKQMPSMDDEFVKSLNISDVHDVASFRNHVQNELVAQLEQTNEQIRARAVSNWIFSAPENKLSSFPQRSLRLNLDKSFQERKKMINQVFKSMGGFSGYLKQINTTEADLRNQMFLDLASELHASTVLNAVVKKEQFTFSESELANAQTQLSAQRLPSELSETDVINQVMIERVAGQQKALELLKARVVYQPKATEATPTTPSENVK